MLLSTFLALFTGTGGHPDAHTTIPEVIPPGSECGRENAAFLPGEEIVYKIYYNLSPLWIAAGEVVFRVDDVGRDYRLTAKAYTYKSYEWFYRGYWNFESRVDKKSLMPHLFVRTIEEKKYSKYNKFIFDQQRNKVTQWEGKTAQEAERSVLDISPCMHDMISVMYYIRNMNFDDYKVGEKVPVNIFLEEEYPLSMHVIGKNEEKRIKGLGKHQTHVFSPEVIAGDVFSEGTQMTVWVTADKNKIPLMIESPVRVGKIKAVLSSHKGLRHSFVTSE